MNRFYKMRDGQLLVVYGHFTKQEVAMLKREGYRPDRPNTTKNGIRICNKGRNKHARNQ